ncbi:MAG: hypothetical protein NXI27_14205 [Alphaproteobacteria bacterium]|nr:hypothetical protein [Alphaproteobacteria bacterium]
MKIAGAGLLCALIALGGFATTAVAKTKRTAWVVVDNQTGEDILSLTINHKYSDEYKNSYTFDKVLKHQRKSKKVEVEYNTGAFTTGKDWWRVSWVQMDGTPRLFYSDPQNLRGFVDFMEGAGDYLIPAAFAAAGAAAGTACTGATGGACAPAGIAATAGAIAAGQALSNKMMNDESTKGFKQHILRKADEGKTVTITLYRRRKGSEIVIKSPSGTSRTKYSYEDVELTGKQKDLLDDLTAEQEQKLQTAKDVRVNRRGQYDYALIIDCYAGVKNGGSANTLTASFHNSAGEQIGEGSVVPQMEKGRCYRFAMYANVADGSTPAKVRLTTDGQDAVMVDKITVYNSRGLPISSSGSDNKSGWCLSTDPSDSQGSWKRHVYQGVCQPSVEFDIDS